MCTVFFWWKMPAIGSRMLLVSIVGCVFFAAKALVLWEHSVTLLADADVICCLDQNTAAEGRTLRRD